VSRSGNLESVETLIGIRRRVETQLMTLHSANRAAPTSSNTTRTVTYW
jgi:hypothetical protein